MRAADDFVAIRARLEQLKRESEPRPARQENDEGATDQRTNGVWKAKVAVLHRPGLV